MGANDHLCMAIFWSGFTVLMLLLLVMRVRNEVAARSEAAALGEIHCTKCDYRGPAKGYSGAFARKVVACPSCKNEELGGGPASVE